MNYELKDLLVSSFVENQKQWESTAKRIALLFLKTYYDNLDYIDRQFDGFLNKKNQTKITSKEYQKLAIIFEIVELRNMVEMIYRDVKIDYEKIHRCFKMMTKKEGDSHQKIVNEMSSENQKIESENPNKLSNLASFEELYFAYNYLISFVEMPEFRRDYYDEYFTNESEMVFDYNKIPTSNNGYFGISSFA